MKKNIDDNYVQKILDTMRNDSVMTSMNAISNPFQSMLDAMINEPAQAAKRGGQVESAGKSRQRVKGESPCMVKISDQLWPRVMRRLPVRGAAKR